jgi:hypothetical protein
MNFNHEGEIVYNYDNQDVMVRALNNNCQGNSRVTRGF